MIVGKKDALIIVLVFLMNIFKATVNAILKHISAHVTSDGLVKIVQKIFVLINAQVKENALTMDVFAMKDGNVNIIF
jgi:hypothetical protein